MTMLRFLGWLLLMLCGAACALCAGFMFYSSTQTALGPPRIESGVLLLVVVGVPGVFTACHAFRQAVKSNPIALIRLVGADRNPI